MPTRQYVIVIEEDEEVGLVVHLYLHLHGEEVAYLDDDGDEVVETVDTLHDEEVDALAAFVETLYTVPLKQFHVGDTQDLVKEDAFPPMRMEWHEDADDDDEVGTLGNVA